MDSLPPTDALSSAFSRMKLQSLISGATDAAGKWALEIPEFDGLKLYLVMKGEGWILLRDAKVKYHLRPGDCLLVTSGEQFIATSDLSLRKVIPLSRAVQSATNGIITINGGGDAYTINVLFRVEGHLPRLIFKGLPPAIHISGDEEQAIGLRSNIERFYAEFRGNKAGRMLVLNNLAPIILVQIVRLYLASNGKQQNWITSLADPKLSTAIEAMQSNPGRTWSLNSLAQRAGMSRGGFALNFKRKVGITPGEYLTNWRMQTACELLREGEENIASIANAVGYQSESAFSTTFQKVVGCRPGIYRSMQRSK